jgi:hypothetical protein
MAEVVMAEVVMAEVVMAEAAMAVVTGEAATEGTVVTMTGMVTARSASV